jgi:hypothetical protein
MYEEVEWVISQSQCLVLQSFKWYAVHASWYQWHLLPIALWIALTCRCLVHNNWRHCICQQMKGPTKTDIVSTTHCMQFLRMTVDLNCLGNSLLG